MYKTKSLRKKTGTEVVDPSSKKDENKTINELTKASKKLDGSFKVYQDTVTGVLQMLITNNQIDKRHIYFCLISNGVLDAG